jgi:hypothetical protein
METETPLTNALTHFSSNKETTENFIPEKDDDIFNSSSNSTSPTSPHESVDNYDEEEQSIADEKEVSSFQESEQDSPDSSSSSEAPIVRKKKVIKKFDFSNMDPELYGLRRSSRASAHPSTMVICCLCFSNNNVFNDISSI